MYIILKDKKAITLISLVITVVIMLILAGVSISAISGEDGLITKANKTATIAELAGYKEELQLYKVKKYLENSNFVETSLTAGKDNLTYNTQADGETGNIKTIITTINNNYLEKLEIIKGELLINTKDAEEVEIALSLGIEVNPYDITEGGELQSSTGNLLLMDKTTGMLTIPDTVTSIGEGAFANLEGLKTIVIPGSVKKIAKNAFAVNVDLENVILQEGVEEIGYGAFRECKNLKAITLPESLKVIGERAFFGCLLIESVNIPGGVEEIQMYTFHGCTSLKNIKLQEGLTTIKFSAFYNTPIESIEIPGTVINIEGNTFRECKNLDNIVLNGNDNFVYESGMLMTAAKDNILFISSKYLSSIATFTIPEGVVNCNISINIYNNITKVVIPASLQTLPNNFMPESIEDVEVTEGNEIYVSENGLLYNKNTGRLLLCYLKDTTIVIPEGIREIGDYSFLPAVNAKTIDITASSITSISANVFNNCKNVEEIRIGANVSDINSNFKYSNYLGTVTIDESNPYYEIQDNILYEKNTNGEKVLVTVLYEIVGAFEITDLNVKEISNYAFHHQTKMTDIDFKDSIETIGNSFNYCYGLTSITIPNNITSIDTACFEYCDNLNEIEIDNTEGSIENAPWGCPAGAKAVIWLRN